MKSPTSPLDDAESVNKRRPNLKKLNLPVKDFILVQYKPQVRVCRQTFQSPYMLRGPTNSSWALRLTF